MSESLELHSKFVSFGAYENSSGVGDAPQTVDETSNFLYFKDDANFDADRYVRREVTSSGSTTYNLEDGTLTDVFNNSVRFASIKALRITNLATVNSEDLNISGDWFTTIFGGALLVKAGGGLFYEAPLGTLLVTPTTADEITIDALGTTISWKVEFIGLAQ